MRFSFAVAIVLATSALATWSQQKEQPSSKTVSETIHDTWGMIENDFVSAADAMPEDRYSFVPTNGEFKRVRTFAEQVKHVACANFAFFNEIEGKTPPPGCDKGGPDPAKSKAELMKYLRDSFAYADKVLATVNSKNEFDPVDGPYGRMEKPGDHNTKLGIVVLAVWHASDHYGQIVEYLRMNGIVPPASR